MPQVIRNAAEGIDSALEIISGTRRIVEINLEQIEKGDNDVSTEGFKGAIERLGNAADELSKAREQMERTRPRQVSAPPIR